MDVLVLVVMKYTHMINFVIDMGHKYIIAEKDKHSVLLSRKKRG